MRLLTLATANTFSGRLVRERGGLEPLADAGADVVALQEVHHLGPVEVARALDRVGLVPTALHLGAGLVLAHARDAEAAGAVVPVGRPLGATLQPAGPLLRWSDHWHERAALAARFAVDAGSGSGGATEVTVVTAHLMVFARAIARGRQVRRLHRALGDPRLGTGPLLVAGDLNHYPGPARPDRALARGLGLSRVELAAPTWRVQGSKHEWLARAGSRLTGWDVERFDAQLDSVLHRGVDPVRTRVLEVASDHAAVVCTFAVGT